MPARFELSSVVVATSILQLSAICCNCRWGQLRQDFEGSSCYWVQMGDMYPPTTHGCAPVCLVNLTGTSFTSLPSCYSWFTLDSRSFAIATGGEARFRCRQAITGFRRPVATVTIGCSQLLVTASHRRYDATVAARCRLHHYEVRACARCTVCCSVRWFELYFETSCLSLDLQSEGPRI